jgi:hypothetical protein
MSGARDGRTNVTLDEVTATELREHIDQLEHKLGFRPTAAQVVRGLIAKARGETPTHNEGGER